MTSATAVLTWVLAVQIWPPAPVLSEPLEVCYGYGCSESALVSLEPREWFAVAAAFQPPATSAATERDQLRVAIAVLESLVGRYTGTHEDRGRNYPGYEHPYQQDCVDESTNTTRYLRALEAQGLLRLHRVVERRLRNRFLVVPHWTAVIEELDTGQRYSVDTWYGDNGAAPDVQPIEDWMAKRRVPRPPLLVEPAQLLCLANR